MKILFLLDIGFDTPGPSVHLLKSIIHSALLRGHKVELILRNTSSNPQNFPESFLLNSNFHYHTINTKKIKKTNFVIRYINEIKYCFKAKKIYKNFKNIDVAFIQSTNVAFFQIGLLKKVLKCPILYNVQDIFPDNLIALNILSKDGIKYKILNKLQSMGYKFATKIMTISPDMKDLLIEKGLSKDKIDYVYNWSYSNEAILYNANNSFEKIANLDKDKFNIIYAGNIGKMQNVGIVVDLAKKFRNVNDVHFYIIGDGVCKSQLQKYSSNLENITFLPFLSSEIAENIYSTADVNIIPLVDGGIKTALPSKTPTCLRALKPIVFCIGKGSLFQKDICGFENVYFSSSNDCDELYDIINKIMKNPIATNIDNFNMNYTSRFSNILNPNKYIECLENILRYEKNEVK